MEGGIIFVLVVFVYILAWIATMLGYLFTMIYVVASYVISGISYMKIAKKLGVPAGWLAFIPVADLFLLGQMAEKSDSDRDPEGKGKRWSVIYPAVYGSYVVVTLLFSLIYIVAMLAVVLLSMDGEHAILTTLLPLCAILLFCALLFVWLAAYYLVAYLVLYKIYRRMAGTNAKWMLVLSIFVPVAQLVILAVLAFSKKYPVANAPSFESAPSPVASLGREQ